MPGLFRIKIIFELQYSGAFAVFLVARLPCLDLALFAAIPLGLALGTLLEFLASLGFLPAVATVTLFITFHLLQTLQCFTESKVT